MCYPSEPGKKELEKRSKKKFWWFFCHTKERTGKNSFIRTFTLFFHPCISILINFAPAF
jgi:hypothetical protein